MMTALWIYLLLVAVMTAIVGPQMQGKDFIAIPFLPIIFLVMFLTELIDD